MSKRSWVFPRAECFGLAVARFGSFSSGSVYGGHHLKRKVKTMRIKSIVLWFLAIILAVFLVHLFIDEMDKSGSRRVDNSLATGYQPSLA